MGTLDALQLLPAMWLGSIVMGLVLRTIIGFFNMVHRNTE